MNHISTALPASASNFLRFEPAPELGSGSLSASDDRLWVTLAHLFPIVAWPLKKSASPAVAAHGKEALNFAITLFIVCFGVGVLGGVLGSLLGTWLALIFSLFSTAVSVAALGLVIFAAIKARSGQLLRYPLNFRFIK